MSVLPLRFWPQSSLRLRRPPPESPAPTTVVREVRLAASPPLGAIPAAFIRNQLEYCGVICPHVVRGAITVPIAAALSPVTFLGALGSTQSISRAIGVAAASVTGPANAAVTPIIVNDLDLVLPKAQHALNVAIVEAFNVGAALPQPGEVPQAVQNARSRILDALNEPMGPPTTPTGARNILQVVTVETVNVASAVVFQAGELLLLGVVQTADATAQELAQSGDPAAALAAGVNQAGTVINAAGGRVASAVDTALTNISDSLNDPFPSTATTTAQPQRDRPESAPAAVAVMNDRPVKPEPDKPTHKRIHKEGSDTAALNDSGEQAKEKPRDEPRSDSRLNANEHGDKKFDAGNKKHAADKHDAGNKKHAADKKHDTGRSKKDAKG